MTTYIYDVNGRIIGRLYTENRVPVRLHEIPEIVRLAFIAAEDDDYLDHHGVRLFRHRPGVFDQLPRRSISKARPHHPATRQAFLSYQ